MGRIDAYGIIVLILFVLFELNRNWIAHFFTSGEALGSVSLVLVTSALFGRISYLQKILSIIRREKVI